MPATPIRFIADEHIAPEILDFLRRRGHEAIRSIDALGLGALDPEIANWASAENAVVLTSDRWFRDGLSRRPGQRRIRYPNAGRILFSGSMTKRDMLARIEQHIERIEREHELQQAQDDKRLIVEITKLRILIEI
jgi:predicted nuclease of predicted toxin-antitoxin system